MPQALPQFLQPHNQQYIRAGWQLRILSQMQPSCKLFVDQIAAVAATEAAEASLILSTPSGMVTPGQHYFSSVPTC